ncbi:hypothetical protein GCM10010389_09290 [Streptomyces echinoruber]|uniref:ANTAR domain-containing protein n=2 Tax=Streptomyces echinoruber TaxID=68898 RepID=A0A918V6H6_9ACTN|nr:hypothetical protein GCM10010389_09290 [Streptomyces echinoruber]
MEGTPVEDAPVEGTPVEGTPAEGAPVEGAPVEGAPAGGAAAGASAEGAPAEDPPMGGIPAPAAPGGRVTPRLRVLEIDRRIEGDGRAVLRPRGELVRGGPGLLAETLAALPPGVRGIDLDMAGVTFMDSAGLEFLDTLAEHGRRRAVPVGTTGWRGQPRRVLELAGLDTTDPLRAPADGPAAPALASSAVARERAERLRLLEEEMRGLQAEIAQLRHAITSRPVIDQARGILMAAHACTSEQAWTILRQTSQLSNTKLRTVAAAVTASAGPGAPPPPPEIRTALRRAVARTLTD